MPERIQLWSCGGGRQSAGLAALMLEGAMRLPDVACMVAIEWEVASTFAYMRKYIRPAMKKLGVPFTMIPRNKYATKDFIGGAEDTSILLPIYSDQSGQMSKLPEYCSGEWKREVIIRWASEQAGWKEHGVDMWM